MSSVSLFYLTEPTYLTLVSELMVKDTVAGYDVVSITNRPDVFEKLKTMGVGATLVLAERVNQETHDRRSYNKFKDLNVQVFKSGYKLNDMFIDRFLFWFQHHDKSDMVISGMKVSKLYIQTSIMDSSPIYVMHSILYDKLNLIVVDDALSVEGVHLLHTLSPDTIYVSTRHQEQLARKVKRNNRIELIETERVGRPVLDGLDDYRSRMKRVSGVLLFFDVRYEWDFRRFLNETEGVFYVVPVNERSQSALPHYLRQFGDKLYPTDAGMAIKLVDQAVLFGYDYTIIRNMPQHVQIVIMDYFRKYESWLPITDEKVLII